MTNVSNETDWLTVLDGAIDHSVLSGASTRNAARPGFKARPKSRASSNLRAIIRPLNPSKNSLIVRVQEFGSYVPSTDRDNPCRSTGALMTKIVQKRVARSSAKPSSATQVVADATPLRGRNLDASVL